MFKTLSLFNTIYNDAPQPWQIGFQDSAAPGFTGIVELHNTIFFYLIVICVGVFWVLGSSIYYFNIKNSPIIHKYLNHGRNVPIQKYSKLNNKIKQFNLVRTYSKLSSNQLKYEKVYANIFDMKKDILNENKGKSGIYMLTNKLTKDLYIEQSINISNRFKNYLNLSYLKSKDSLKISRALLKYGYSNFSLTILEYCDKSNLLIREQYYFDKLNPQYNLLKKVGKNNPLFGKTQSENSIKLMKQKALSIKHFENVKLKMSAISGNLVNIYEKFTSSGYNLIGSFVSVRRAGKFLGISRSTVIKYMNSGAIYKDRYKFSSK